MPALLTFGTISLGHALQVAALCLSMAAAPVLLRGGEPRIIALHSFEQAEVRQQGFVLPRAAKIHVYARGAGLRRIVSHSEEHPFFATGWILNAATREVVWQMDGMNTKRDWEYRIADQYLDLPAGSYEAYFANHGFGQSLLVAQWTRNIDRRNLKEGPPGRRRGFLAAIGADDASLLRHWRSQVGNYGMEIYLPGGDPAEVALFDAPLRWQNIVAALPATADDSRWTQAFRLRKPTSLHVYAEGEGSGRRMLDYGWITNARTRERVWEMTVEKSQYAGGARKNRRQVETLQLPAGEYEATFGTDDSHSPADWNAVPPCDPGMYGLTLAVASEADLPSVSLITPPAPTVLAELARIGDDEDRRTAFTLSSAKAVRVYAIGEASGEEVADGAWIEDASGARVWTMERSRTHHAGGALKNRLADEVVRLPKGTYTLRYRTDDSHAYGRWNSAAPWDPEHYGVTVYAAE